MGRLERPSRNGFVRFFEEVVVVLKAV